MSAESYHLGSNYASPIDIAPGDAYAGLLRIDPVAALAALLNALGVADRAIWAESTGATDAMDGGDARQIGFSLIWRFGPPDQTAMIRWQVRLSENGVGRTMIAIGIQATPSGGEARDRLVAAWPIIETIALQHAKNLRNAVEEQADDLAQSPREQQLGRAGRLLAHA